MKINSQILSLPPYISTSWKHVTGIFVQGSKLFIELSSGATVTIENLSANVIETIFNEHSKHLESNHDNSSSSSPHNSFNPFVSAAGDSPIQLGISSLDNLGNAMQHMQHNPAFADAPDLPSEMLEKISAITRIIAPDETINLPEAQHKCNCPHCQIARAIGGIKNIKSEQQEENEDSEKIVTPDELVFNQWDIQQTGPQLFQVINRLDTNEVYQVYLGDPIGCTCGHPGCEHIPAVLKS
jgi:hypothetical protein